MIPLDETLPDCPVLVEKPGITPDEIDRIVGSAGENCVVEHVMVAGNEPDNELGLEGLEFAEEFVNIRGLPSLSAGLIHGKHRDDKVLCGVAGFGDCDGFVGGEVSDC